MDPMDSLSAAQLALTSLLTSPNSSVLSFKPRRLSSSRSGVGAMLANTVRRFQKNLNLGSVLGRLHVVTASVRASAVGEAGQGCRVCGIHKGLAEGLGLLSRIHLGWARTLCRLSACAVPCCAIRISRG